MNEDQMEEMIKLNEILTHAFSDIVEMRYDKQKKSTLKVLEIITSNLSYWFMETKEGWEYDGWSKRLND